MQNLFKHWIFISLVVVSTTMTAVGGESVVYDFDGWKVTITPGRSASKPDRPSAVQSVVPSPKETQSDAAVNRQRTAVIPISYVEDDKALSAQKPGAVNTAPAPNLAPTPSETALPLPPSPPPEMPVVSATESCELPVITPMSPDKAPLPILGMIPPQTALYRDIYFSIPFNRAEYNAYPSYRHDATMELLFNQMRNTIIQRGTTNVYQYDMNYGWGSIYTPYYPYNYGLRIHSSR